MTLSSQIADALRGVAGAGVGATLGYYTFQWILGHGFYGMMIPGAFLGLGCGLAARRSSTVRGVACAIAALALGLFVEWRFFPFRADPGFGYFVSKLHDLNTITLLMIAAGSFFAYLSGREGGAGYFGSRVSRPTGRPDLNSSGPD